jgi:DNA-3-methyladenine glycosylase II
MTNAPGDETLRPALEALALVDRDLARAYRVCGLPPVRRQAPGFPGLVRIIMAQQVSTASAGAIIGRLEAAVRPLTAEGFLALDDSALRAIGLSRQKIVYGRALAEELRAGRLDLDVVATLDDDAALDRLVGLKGVGRWTAEIYLLFALAADDLAVQVAAQRLKGLDERPKRPRMVALAEPWRPHRSAAARLLWHLYRHPGVPTGEG